MPFLNGYVAPPPLATAEYHATTPRSEYDLNWEYGVVPERLETQGGVRLVPLIPSIHGKRLYDLFSAHPESYAYLPYGPFDSFAAFLTKLELARRDPATLLYAVFDQSLILESERQGDEDDDVETRIRHEETNGRRGEDGTTERGEEVERLAGIVGFKESQSRNRMSEIGHVHIPPPFQRTHVSTHAVSLLLHYALDPPRSSQSQSSEPGARPALGLRRVQWFANPLNSASVRAAERIGFLNEARLVRWERTLPTNRGKVMLDMPQFLEDDDERPEWEAGWGGGRHSTLLSMDWERWEGKGGGRELVDELVRRPVRRRRIGDIEGLKM
ncbi:hypothetical protein JCM10212_000545 [Sporobolomyces blumeae]